MIVDTAKTNGLAPYNYLKYLLEDSQAARVARKSVALELLARKLVSCASPDIYNQATPNTIWIFSYTNLVL